MDSLNVINVTNVDGAKSQLRCEKPSMIPSRQARGRGGTRGGGVQIRLKAVNHNPDGDLLRPLS